MVYPVSFSVVREHADLPAPKPAKRRPRAECREDVLV
jgi:hypothetical protein